MSEQDDFSRGFHGIPDDGKLRAMSYLQLAEALQGSAAGEPKYLVIEKEMKLRIAADQAKVNRANVLLGGLMAGCFGLAGVVLGWYLRESQPGAQVTNSNAVQKVHPANLTIKPPLGNIPAGQSVASQPVNVPAQIQGNSSASKPRP